MEDVYSQIGAIMIVFTFGYIVIQSARPTWRGLKFIAGFRRRGLVQVENLSHQCGKCGVNWRTPGCPICD